MDDSGTIRITRSTPHAAQQRVMDEADRFNVVSCGRRWGKTQMGVELLVPEVALAGGPVGWFAPTYKLLDEAWAAVLDMLRPLDTLMGVNKQERIIRLPNGGRIDFWTLAGTTAETSQAGRGRKYARVFVDEAAHARYLEADWTKAIRPTLADLRGDAWFLSTPRGHNFFHKLWVKGQDGAAGWKSWRMPTAENPFIHPDEIEAAKHDLPRDAFQQEYLAEFLADAANPFGIHAIRACVRELEHREPVVWGVDLAKSTDWTVTIGLDAAGNVCQYQRWQSDWRNTTARVAGMIGTTPALVDSTGVGDPIVEELQARCPHVEGYKFSSQSKQQIMEGLAVAIQRSEVTFPDGPIVNELESFEYEYRPSGVRYTAPEGSHDDCVDALALAVRCQTVQPVAAVLDARGGDYDEDRRWFMDPVDDDDLWVSD